MASYTVTGGNESWESIAGKIYGDQRMFYILMSANPGINILKTGMVLRLPKKQENIFISEKDWAQNVAATATMANTTEAGRVWWEAHAKQEHYDILSKYGYMPEGTGTTGGTTVDIYDPLRGTWSKGPAPIPSYPSSITPAKPPWLSGTNTTPPVTNVPSTTVSTKPPWLRGTTTTTPSTPPTPTTYPPIYGGPLQNAPLPKPWSYPPAGGWSSLGQGTTGYTGQGTYQPATTPPTTIPTGNMPPLSAYGSRGGIREPAPWTGKSVPPLFPQTAPTATPETGVTPSTTDPYAAWMAQLEAQITASMQLGVTPTGAAPSTATVSQDINAIKPTWKVNTFLGQWNAPSEVAGMNPPGGGGRKGRNARSWNPSGSSGGGGGGGYPSSYGGNQPDITSLFGLVHWRYG